MPNHAFHEDDIGYLPGFLPGRLGREHRRIRTGEHPARVRAVEAGNAGTVDERIIRTVVNQHDAVGGHDGCGAGFHHARVESPRPARQHRHIERFSPVDEIHGVRQAHLVGLVGGGAEEIHPVFSVDLFRHDGPRLGPAHVPPALVRGQNHPHPVPVNEVFRRGQAQLGILLVVAGVGEIVRVTEPHQPRILDAAARFVVGFGRQHRLRPTREADAVRAGGVPQARGAGPVLGTIEHDDLAVVPYHGGVERACGLPPIALRGQHGAVRDAAPCPEGPSISLTREEQGAQYEQQPKALARVQEVLPPCPPTCGIGVLTPCPPLPAGAGERCRATRAPILDRASEVLTVLQSSPRSRRLRSEQLVDFRVA